MLCCASLIVAQDSDAANTHDETDSSKSVFLHFNNFFLKKNKSNLNKNNFKADNSDLKKYRKRLETIDGVEIASSYVEYLDLAFGDLDDRLKKSYVKLADFKDRVSKRSSLLKEITAEIEKRRGFSQSLSEKDKLLRTRLIRNTEMKSALQNLADIAGYKLNSEEKSKIYSKSAHNTHEMPNANLFLNLLNETSQNEQETRNISHILVNSLGDQLNNSSYTRYIEMAYKEVTDILTNDKQTLIVVIRKLKTNEFKLKELEQLKVKVNSSLSRLTTFESRLSTMINQDSDIAPMIQLNLLLKFINLLF